MNELEYWASPEPTIARVRADVYRDQRRETGHYQRLGDIERLASLGITATRYPVLWESVAPTHPSDRNYAWEDERLRELERFSIEPIVTLMHHGSGPSYTSLSDPAFPELFADYAEATARRYPHVARWTPLNEPLTTARFSTLYGVWYPNERSDAAFGRAIVNETLAYLLAVRRIRRIVPAARFMLTEDLQNFVAGDARARDYARHKHERSFLSIELAAGLVTPAHAMWEYLTRVCDISTRTLERIRRLAARPDVVGWNYYPNSERYLSTRPDGSFENRSLIDCLDVNLDPKPLLREASRRLNLPFAISEVHVHGTDRDRAHWLIERHGDVNVLRNEGVDIGAFGAWAAFGLVDWNSLLRERNDAIEDGLFACRPDGGVPELMLAGDVFRSFRRRSAVSVPGRGWWDRRDDYNITRPSVTPRATASVRLATPSLEKIAAT